MPRMSKKWKQELSFFLNDRGCVSYSALCRRCVYPCKQSFRALVIGCPHYLSKRAKGGKNMVDFMTKERVITDWVVFPRFLMDYAVGFTAKWTYTLLYNEMLNHGEPDADGHYFV